MKNDKAMPRTRPQRRLTQAELDAFLEKAADLLRGGVDHSEFRGYVFALLFYKRINDVYLENVAALEQELNDAELARDPRMPRLRRSGRLRVGKGGPQDGARPRYSA